MGGMTATGAQAGNMPTSGSWVNQADHAQITVNSNGAAALSPDNILAEYFPQTQSYTAVNPANGNEQVSGFGSGGAAVIFHGWGVWVSSTGTTTVSTPDGQQTPLGNIDDPQVQHQIQSVLNPMAYSDLMNALNNRGSIGLIPWIKSSFAPSTQQALVTAQAQSQAPPAQSSSSGPTTVTAAQFAAASPQAQAAYLQSLQAFQNSQYQSAQMSAVDAQGASGIASQGLTGPTATDGSGVSTDPSDPMDTAASASIGNPSDTSTNPTDLTNGGLSTT